MQNQRQLYRMRARASGREALATVDPDGVYVDRVSGEELEPVTRVLPLAPSESALVRSPENLRICRRCDQLIGLDVTDCPHCGLRQPAFDGSPGE
jgi:ribosomal protein L40E